MSKVVILKIDTLSHVFTTLESGSKCQFQYELINNDRISNVIQPLVANDTVLCAFDDVIKIALRVVGKTVNKITLTKEIELNEGYQITDENVLRVLNDTQIYECNFDFKQNLYESLTENFKFSLKQLFEIDVTEDIEINSDNTPAKSLSSEHIQLLTFTPTQIIYYGVPGTGKSFQVDTEINKAISKYNEEKSEDDKISFEKQVIRIVFHPDYGNADFVGQIMPKTREDNRGVDYVFKAGPFSQILRKAYLNPNKPYFLVIEEINRGNAAAIFGDIFQSLDRLKNNETSDSERIRNEVYKYTAGWSKYGVTNEEINSYILDIEKNSERDPNIDYDSDDSTNAPKAAIKIPARGMHFSINSAIRLPPNLSIYATMNTSDQNVFTLDNAFQRRWEMKQVSNDLAHDDPAADTTKQYDQIIGSTSVKWGEFRENINEIIMQSAEENGLSSMEDKRLGGWFITPKKTENSEEIKITDEAFAEKVLKYLWDDAFKFDRSKHFGDIKTLEDLTKIFKKEGFKVFKDESISKLSPQNGTAAAQTGTPET